MLIMHNTDDSITRPEWITDMGNYNTLPLPRKECNVHRLIHLLATHMPTAMDHRQVIIPSMGSMLRNTNILFFPHCAIAIVMPSSWDAGCGIQYKLTECRFFELGCEHEYTELSQESARRVQAYGGDCYHVNECDICGHVKSVDSSG